MAISHIQNLQKYPNHKNKKGCSSTENLCPKTSLSLAAGAEEEDVEQADTAYMAGSFRLPQPGPEHSPQYLCYQGVVTNYYYYYYYIDRQIDRQTYRQKNRDRQIDRQIDRSIDIQIDRERDREENIERGYGVVVGATSIDDATANVGTVVADDVVTSDVAPTVVGVAATPTVAATIDVVLVVPAPKPHSLRISFRSLVVMSATLYY